ncbi:MAG: hypothetical protein EON54_18980 [Alcaligenaceae bacterium]|nr:MAG: hypothetical protein EON54_18980 [Alcaligenaceae bacterium]
MTRNFFLQAKQKGLTTAKSLRVVALGVAATAATTLPAFAQQTAPDVSELVAYLLLGIGVVALIGNASLMVKGAVAIFSWIRGAIR